MNNIDMRSTSFSSNQASCCKRSRQLRNSEETTDVSALKITIFPCAQVICTIYNGKPTLKPETIQIRKILQLLYGGDMSKAAPIIQASYFYILFYVRKIIEKWTVVERGEKRKVNGYLFSFNNNNNSAYQMYILTCIF